MTRDLEGLLPCPFCGCWATATPDGAPDGNYSVECANPDCQATFANCHTTRAGAIAAWNTRATGWQPIATAPGLITLAEQKTGLESAPDRPGPTNEIDVTPEMVRAAIHAYYCGLDPRWHSDEDIFEYVCREIFKFAGLRVRGSD